MSVHTVNVIKTLDHQVDGRFLERINQKTLKSVVLSFFS